MGIKGNVVASADCAQGKMEREKEMFDCIWEK
jgi:hypothetical protein